MLEALDTIEFLRKAEITAFRFWLFCSDNVALYTTLVARHSFWSGQKSFSLHLHFLSSSLAYAAG